MGTGVVIFAAKSVIPQTWKVLQVISVMYYLPPKSGHFQACPCWHNHHARMQHCPVCKMKAYSKSSKMTLTGKDSWQPAAIHERISQLQKGSKDTSYQLVLSKRVLICCRSHRFRALQQDFVPLCCFSRSPWQYSRGHLLTAIGLAAFGISTFPYMSDTSSPRPNTSSHADTQHRHAYTTSP